MHAQHAKIASSSNVCAIDGKPVSIHLPPNHPRRAIAGHVIPLNMGGTNHPTNYQVECFDCSCHHRQEERIRRARRNGSRDW